LVLSMYDETLHAERSLAAGARGYIMKQEAMHELLGAIRRVSTGKTYVSPGMAERIVTRVTHRGTRDDTRTPIERLTGRELEVFTMVGRGLTTRDMAQKLGIKPAEFKNKWEQEIPMRRLGEPREFAALAAFLVSERAAYITGTSIQVDGGWIRSLL